MLRTADLSDTFDQAIWELKVEICSSLPFPPARQSCRPTLTYPHTGRSRGSGRGDTGNGHKTRRHRLTCKRTRVYCRYLSRHCSGRRKGLISPPPLLPLSKMVGRWSHQPTITSAQLSAYLLHFEWWWNKWRRNEDFQAGSDKLACRHRSLTKCLPRSHKSPPGACRSRAHDGTLDPTSEAQLILEKGQN